MLIKEEKFICSVCDREFETIKALNMHEKRVNGITVPPSRSCSEETKRKLREANVGKFVSKETKDKIRETMLAKNLKFPREIGTCLYCGNNFEYIITRDRRFCSRNHYNAYRAKKISLPKLCECGCGRIAPSGGRFIHGHNRKNRIDVPREVRICPNCGKGFSCRVTSTKKFCSDICSNHHENGYVTLNRLGITLRHRSSYEKEASLLLDRCLDVVNVSYEPIRIGYKDDNGICHKYVPDYVVVMRDGSSFVIEVKPRGDLEDRINQLKFVAVRNYVEKHNMTFLVWTEDILFSNKNGSTTTLMEVISSATAASLVA